VNKSSPLRRRQGFTLIEVMVVMVLISIIITFAVLSIDTGPEELRREGNRIATLMDLAADEAVMNGREYRVVFQRQGYAFEEFRDSEWQPSGDELLHPRDLPAGMRMSLSLENEPVELAAPEEQLTEKKSSLQLLSSGEIPSFELTISDEKARKFIVREQEGRIIGSSSDQENLS
jgi:general secretion pathway protein H